VHVSEEAEHIRLSDDKDANMLFTATGLTHSAMRHHSLQYC